MNKKKLFRLYHEEAVRRRRGRKRATGTRTPMTRAQRSAGTRPWTAITVASKQGVTTNAACEPKEAVEHLGEDYNPEDYDADATARALAALVKRAARSRKKTSPTIEN